jgi:chromate transporter
METIAPSTSRIFWVFLGIAARSFGGAASWARRALVEEQGWLAEEEFATCLSVCQVLPGPNVVNLAVFLGDRWRGPRGALAAFAGLMLVPTVFAIGLELLLLRWLHMQVLQAALLGLGAGAAGLIAELGLKMGKRLVARPVALGIAGLAFLAAGPLQLPMAAVVLALAPPSLALTLWRRR